MGKKAPEPTDPRETSAAQTGSNVSTAIANAFLNNPSEITPDGTKTTNQTGSYQYRDPYTGQTYTIPTFTTTQTLSEMQQKIKGQQDEASLGLSTLGNQQTAFLQDYLNKPVDLNNSEVESRLFELGRSRLDPKFNDQRQALESRLSNQGIKIGSAAYDRALGNFGQQENDAYNQLLLSGRGQAVQEALTQRNQPINEITALLSGGQVSTPQFITGFQGSQIPTTDNASIIANYDQQRAQSAAANGAGIGSALSGIGGLFALSDERAKTNISKVGKTKDGLGIYSYRYKGEGDNTPLRMGLMAQEVEKKKPDAVATRPDGLKAVNYDRALSL